MKIIKTKEISMIIYLFLKKPSKAKILENIWSVQLNYQTKIRKYKPKKMIKTEYFLSNNHDS